MKSVCADRIIEEVETTEDTIVYAGSSHTEFVSRLLHTGCSDVVWLSTVFQAAEVKGRKVLDVVRYGKVFYMVLEGGGRMPVLHLGMTGMDQASSTSSSAR